MKRILKEDKDFFEAALKKARVTVFSDGHVVDYGGTIEKYSPLSVKIKDTYYMRNQYEFRV
ncbi:hypothetical protein ACFSUM_18425 [Virgibacillus siamensis]|uniref:hypothetical protein n=1 Tax=Virgibacillus siamensis TaxID=480071 RepID=UPI0036366F75